jgi:hypothetical protein
MESAVQIYSYSPDRFRKRLWRILRIPFFAWIVLIIFPVIFSRQFNFILGIWIVIVTLGFLIIPLSYSFKYARFQIVSIVNSNDLLIFEVVDQNIPRVINIEKYNLETRISWTILSPRSMKLTIFDSSKEILSIYSGGISSIESEVDKIGNRLNKIKNAST